MIPENAITEWREFGKTDLLTYDLDELVGTKVRALYQRLKGRDLYDLYKALSISKINTDRVMLCFRQYMGFVVEHIPTYKEFVLNMEEKLKDEEFLGDTKNLLRQEESYDPLQSYDVVRSRLIDKLME